MGKVNYRNYEFPKKARYIRNKNRLYFSWDFEDGEIITFAYTCTKPSGTTSGYAWYTNGSNTRLTHLSELEKVVE